MDSNKAMDGWIEQALARFGPRPVLVGERGAMNGVELAQRVAAVRTLLAEQGLSAGSRLLLSVSDDRHLLCLVLGALDAGVVAMIADPEQPAAATQALVAHHRPDAVACDAGLASIELAAGVRIEVAAEPEVRKGALMQRLLGRSRQRSEGFLALLDAQVPAPRGSEPGADQPALVFFTSGSTAAPRAVELSHGAIRAHLRTLARQHGYVPGSRILDPLPLHHVDGLVQGPLVALHAGATLYRPLQFRAQDVARFLDLVYSEAITHLVAVPTMLSLALRLGSAQADAFRTAEFRHVVSTAGHLEEGLWRRFEAHFGVLVTNTYGLTETVAGGLFSGPDGDTRRVGTIGKPVDCEIRIVDEADCDVPPGGTGELLLRGENVMTGYYRNPEATAEALRAGWLHTGDLVRRDADGFVHFVGRAKNVILSGGHTIYPEEVTDVLNRHAEVSAAACLGLPHAEWEEVAVAAVVLVPGARVSEGDLLDHCRGWLAGYKVPRRIRILAGLPYGPSGKVRMEELRKEFETESPQQAPGAGYESRVLDVARRVFRDHRGELHAGSGPDNTVGWDSLSHMEFISALEAEFGVALVDRDIMRITGVEAAGTVIRQHLRNER